jgi:hypothetical protein
MPAAPLAEVISGPAARKIAEVLQHKRICHALNDYSFSRSFRGQHTAIDYNCLSKFKIGPDEPINHLLLDAGVTITNMSVFLRMLPDKEVQKAPAHPAHKATSLAKDLIIIDSPALLEPDAFDRLKAGLGFFRSAHPHAAVVVSMPFDGNAALQMEVLKDEGLVDDLGPDLRTNFSETSHHALYCGALILEKKLKAVEAALSSGEAALHCSADDRTETVLIEPIQP